MDIKELRSLVRSRLMNRGIPVKSHVLKDNSFFVSVMLSGDSLTVEIPYTIRKEGDIVIVLSDNEIFKVKKLSSAVKVITKDIRSQRSSLSKYTKGGA